MVLYVVRRAPAAPLALLAVPGGEGLRAPTPRTPTRGKLSLQAFARLRARAALRAGCFVLAHGANPYVCAGAWCCTPHGALVARSCRAARAARGPRGRGAARPYPRTPTRGKLSLQAFARLRARAALRAGVSVLAHGATRMFVLAHAATRRVSIRRVSIASVVADARARGKDDGDAGGFDARADGVAQVLGVAVGE